MTNPSAKKQLANIWQGAVDDLMAMSESEIDAELRELGIDPQVAAEKGKVAVEKAVAKDRARLRAAQRAQMEAARARPKVIRDPSITPEQARQRIAQLQAANDALLTLAARNRSPQDLSDQEALDLFWNIQDLKH
ncbi:MAG: hypothetical protein U1D36_10385 [Hydrogenophaga sp.]|uniref:hypothetical protein n=1 Tax=Hydrogenophaga sp. TaxID=1904254 RepID=UPI002ABBE6A1|nr:hypothetical protein [Hydrogenophaga sp.]MDZ4174867.1 hypothetical protein [Hydrogenophaga sp.]